MGPLNPFLGMEVIRDRPKRTISLSQPGKNCIPSRRSTSIILKIAPFIHVKCLWTQSRTNGNDNLTDMPFHEFLGDFCISSLTRPDMALLSVLSVHMQQTLNFLTACRYMHGTRSIQLVLGPDGDWIWPLTGLVILTQDVLEQDFSSKAPVISIWWSSKLRQHREIGLRSKMHYQLLYPEGLWLNHLPRTLHPPTVNSCLWNSVSYFHPPASNKYQNKAHWS
jgi:hypothetical protein